MTNRYKYCTQMTIQYHIPLNKNSIVMDDMLTMRDSLVQRARMIYYGEDYTLNQWVSPFWEAAARSYMTSLSIPR